MSRSDAFVESVTSFVQLVSKNIKIYKSVCLYFKIFNLTNSYYYDSQVNGITGNIVEFTPKFNVKTGLKYDYKKMMLKFQYTYLSSQFTDASNAVESDITGIIGEIPEYDILDLSFGINLKLFSLYYGINNLTNNLYYTRRATGYPGPGIIPSPNRNYYITFEVKL